MQCGSCGAGMETIQYEGVEIDVCSGCNGIWLDAGELEKIVKKREETFDQKTVDELNALVKQSHAMPAAEIARKVVCPKCQKDMTPANYQYSSNIIIDRCPDGHGVWLDPGELDKVQVYREQWMDEMEKNRSHYEQLAQKVKLESEQRIRETGKVRVSHFNVINSLLSGIVKLDF